MLPEEEDLPGPCGVSSSDPGAPSSQTLSYLHDAPPAPVATPGGPKVPGVLSAAAIRDDVVFEHYEIVRRADGTPWELGRGAMGGTRLSTPGCSSVGRSGNHVRVNVQLVSAGDSHQLWAESYDRQISDLLTLQGELAREITTALRATLSPQERERVAAKPTSNPDAYLLFLRAREKENAPDLLEANLVAAEDLLVQTTALDPDFALAYARLSRVRKRVLRARCPSAGGLA